MIRSNLTCENRLYTDKYFEPPAQGDNEQYRLPTVQKKIKRIEQEWAQTMWFCPLDGTLLQVRHAEQTTETSATGYFFCATCPYSCPITTTVTKKSFPARKMVDDILGGEEAWANVDRTQTSCPRCNHNEAYFMQMQIRSADEPMSVFYKCVKCSHQWNDKWRAPRFCLSNRYYQLETKKRYRHLSTYLKRFE